MEWGEDEDFDDGWYRAAVAGESFANEDGSNRQAEIARCRAGEAVTLVRDPANRFDANAILVVSARGVQIGFVARKAAEWLAVQMDRGAPVVVEIDRIVSREGGAAGVVLKLKIDWPE